MRMHDCFYRKAFLGFAAVVVGWGVLCADVNGQVINSSGGLTATGQKEIALQPTRIRLVLQIQAEGRDAKEAIKNLADHKKKVNEALKEMKADLASIQFEANKMSEAMAGMPQDAPGAPRMIVQANNDPFGEQDAEGAETPAKIFTAKSSVQVEWELPTEDLDALSLLPEALKLQIQKRDLQGKKIKAELSEEEKEFATDYVRRITQQRGYYSSNSQAQPEIQVIYVANVTVEQEKEALKAAYQEALANAQTLAEATGQKLGKIRSIMRSDSSVSDAMPTAYEYDQYGNAIRRQITKRNPHEVSSTTPAHMSKTVGVTLVFAIE